MTEVPRLDATGCFRRDDKETTFEQICKNLYAKWRELCQVRQDRFTSPSRGPTRLKLSQRLLVVAQIPLQMWAHVGLASEP